MKVVLVGGGKLAYYLSRVFAAKNHEVCIVSRDAEECQWLARNTRATVVCGDGSDPQILEQAGMRAASVVLAITPNDPDNLVVAQLAERRFGVPRRLALVNDPESETVFARLGVEAVSMTRVLSQLIEQKTEVSEITNLILVGEGKLNATQLDLPPDAPGVGQSLREIGLPENSLVAGIVREGEPIVPRGETVLAAGDRIVLITVPRNHGEVLRALMGVDA